ncbi:MAG TPA: lytic murein transglycosylase B [Rhodocyclaceae bacterium]|nr:lytic murein transglycosylase B [Rhodocyclaceae bacterium]
MKRHFLTAILLLAAMSAQATETYAERADVKAFVAEMAEHHGFDPDRLLTHFRKVRRSLPVLRAIMPPADPGIRSWQAYHDRFVEPARIARGVEFWHRHETTLARAEALYGVPAEIVVAIIGVETIYGRHMGRFEVFNALTNLAFDYPPRADLFRRELESLLLLARDEQRNPWHYRGSYAGAIGLPQFLPSSVRSYAVDFDGDGRIDLAGSADDAIGSVGRFLAEHGWSTGEEIARSVKVSGGDTPVLLAEGIHPARLPAEMAPFGVQADGAPALRAALIDLTTPDAPTEYRLGFNNFFVLTRYNRSTFYAAAIIDLASALKAARDDR